MITPRYYILKDKKVIPETNFLRWIVNKQNKSWMVKKSKAKDIVVSTVFLGIDHGFTDDKKPILFETMIFGGPYDGDTLRCSIYEEAEKDHETMCERILQLIKRDYAPKKITHEKI